LGVIYIDNPHFNFNGKKWQGLALTSVLPSKMYTKKCDR